MKSLQNTCAAFLVFLSMSVFAQTDKATTIKVLQNQDFIFQATSAMPMANNDVTRVLNRMNNSGGGGTINLNGSQYDLTIKKDSITAYLPYYGRAYTATMNPDDSGTKFKSKKFNYTSVKKKKGGWTITIEPKDVKDSQKLTLDVSENGYATLYVNNINRQPISYYGYISEPKKAK